MSVTDPSLFTVNECSNLFIPMYDGLAESYSLFIWACTASVFIAECLSVPAFPNQPELPVPSAAKVAPTSPTSKISVKITRFIRFLLRRATQALGDEAAALALATLKHCSECLNLCNKLYHFVGSQPTCYIIAAETVPLPIFVPSSYFSILTVPKGRCTWGIIVFVLDFAVIAGTKLYGNSPAVLECHSKAFVLRNTEHGVLL